MPSRTDSSKFTNSPAAMRKLALGLFIACFVAKAMVGYAAGGVRDDFESAEVSWRPGDADGQYRLESHQRIDSDPHSGRGS